MKSLIVYFQDNVMAAQNAILHKVRAAYDLKDSTVYDPNLQHKSPNLTGVNLELSHTAALPEQILQHSELIQSPQSTSLSQPFADSLNFSGDVIGRWTELSPDSYLVDSFWFRDGLNNNMQKY